MQENLPYNIKNPRSIFEYSKGLLGKTLREFVWDGYEPKKGKGSVGQMVENLYFLLETNNYAGADFSEAGMELKCTPLKEGKKEQYLIKERLVCNMINYCDVVNTIIDGKNVKKCKEKNKNITSSSNIKNIPLLGKVDVKKVSLPIISIVIGLVDGFNPCAMWVLLFLITMFINMKDRRRMWILGFTFILSSALVYLMFMLAYLHIASALIQTWFKYIIALVALVGGIINLRSYYKERQKDIGCSVTDAKKRRKIVDKIKKILSEKSFIFAFFGIIFLAFSVNLIELACSAGLPVMFTNIIAMNNVSAPLTALYFFLYLLFFMIDDIIVFSIAMITFKVTGISNKYSKYSHLIGGIIMIIIGLLMAFKTEWLMFNF